MKLLKCMGNQGLVSQLHTGQIIIGKEGERLLRKLDFYTAFVAPVDYDVVNSADAKRVGMVQSMPEVGYQMILAGRRWIVDRVDEKSRKIFVTRIATGGSIAFASEVPEDEAMVLKLLTWLMIRKYDSFFSENLYSFRPHYGAKHALRRLLDDPESSQYHSYKLDVRNYFNSIDVSMLLPILEGLLVDDKPLYKFLSGLLLDPRVIDEGNMVEEQKGGMAGMPFAVFLANVFLTPLDRKFEQMPGVIYCRYSDDVVIFSKDKDILEAAKLSSGISTGNSTHPKATARSTGRGGTFR